MRDSLAGGLVFTRRRHVSPPGSGVMQPDLVVEATIPGASEVGQLTVPLDHRSSRLTAPIHRRMRLCDATEQRLPAACHRVLLSRGYVFRPSSRGGAHAGEYRTAATDVARFRLETPKRIGIRTRRSARSRSASESPCRSVPKAKTDCCGRRASVRDSPSGSTATTIRPASSRLVARETGTAQCSPAAPRTASGFQGSWSPSTRTPAASAAAATRIHAPRFPRLRGSSSSTTGRSIIDARIWRSSTRGRCAMPTTPDRGPWARASRGSVAQRRTRQRFLMPRQGPATQRVRRPGSAGP